MEEKKSGKWEFCYIINEKEPKDNPSKIQCRRHEEDWKVLEGFNEECGENMQSRITKKEFEPFTLNIEINTLDEAKSLWNRFNLNNDTLCKSMGSLYYNVELQNIINDMKYWKQLDNILKDLGEEPDVKS